MTLSTVEVPHEVGESLNENLQEHKFLSRILFFGDEGVVKHFLADYRLKAIENPDFVCNNEVKGS